MKTLYRTIATSVFESFSLYFAGQLVTVGKHEFTTFGVTLHLTKVVAQKTDMWETCPPWENTLINDDRVKKILSVKYCHDIVWAWNRIPESKQNAARRYYFNKTLIERMTEIPLLKSLYAFNIIKNVLSDAHLFKNIVFYREK